MVEQNIFKSENTTQEKELQMKETPLLPNPEDLCLLEYSQVFSCCSIFHKEGMSDAIGTFDLSVRDLPKNRNFMIAGGLEDVINFIKNLRFNEKHIKYLLEQKMITPEFAEYLKGFKFTGNVWAMPEGTIFFPKETVVRITAPITEGNLITTTMTNLFSLPTILMSKIIRVVLSAKGAKVGIGFIRTHGVDTSLKVQRASIIAGCRAVSSPLAGMFYGLPVGSGMLYHAYVQNFPTEYEAFKAVADNFPLRFNLPSDPIPRGYAFMVDTYDTIKGVENVIKLARELKKQGKPHMPAIALDSGDLTKLSIEARKMLDDAGFKDIEISASGNLTEKKITKMIKEGAKIDRFIAVTDVVTSADDPKLEVIYKLAEMEINGKIIPTMKWSPGKRSLPSKKQVFRILENGKWIKDIIGLDNENLGEALLIPIIQKGKLVYSFPKITEIREYVLKQLEKLPNNYKSVSRVYSYPVEFSNNLQNLVESLKPSY